MLLDLRKMGSGDESASSMIVSQVRAGNDILGESDDPVIGKEQHPPGAIDMALREEEGKTHALCLMDGALRAFRLNDGAEAISHMFDFDIVAKHDRKNVPCAIVATDDIV